MPSGSFLDSATDLALARAVPLVWSRSYDSRSAGNDGDLGRGWSHGFETSVIETTDADAALGSTSLDAVLPLVVATVAAEDWISAVTAIPAAAASKKPPAVSARKTASMSRTPSSPRSGSRAGAAWTRPAYRALRFPPGTAARCRLRPS